MGKTLVNVGDPGPPYGSHEASTPLPRYRRSSEVDLTDWPVEDLLELRTLIDQKLPARALKDMNVEMEMVLQFMALQALQTRVINDDDVPANQQAQVANSLSASISTLAKLQNEVYTSERIKRIEGILVDTINTLPDEQRDQFLDEYEAALHAAAS